MSTSKTASRELSAVFRIRRVSEQVPPPIAPVRLYKITDEFAFVIVHCLLGMESRRVRSHPPLADSYPFAPSAAANFCFWYSSAAL